MCSKFSSISLVVTALFISSTALAVTENLDEAMARKNRLPSAIANYNLLENGTTHYWQPETLNYSATTTGSEVWRFTYSPSGVGGTTQDIASAHFSANGNRVLFTTDRANSIETSGGANNKTWFIGNTDGSKLRPGIGLSTTWANWSYYPAWNPSLSDVLYFPGDSSGGNIYTIYKNTVGDSSISKTAVVNVDSSVGRRLVFKKSIAADGSKLYFFDSNNANYAWSLNLLTNTLETPTTGYDRRINFDLYWGGTVTYGDYHDEYIAGAANGVDGIWKYIMPETSATDGPWWRSRLTGAGANNAPTHTQDRTAPYNWGGELEPVSTVTSGSTAKPDPWCPAGTVAGTECSAYQSHFAPDRWGHYSAFARAEDTQQGYVAGVSVYDLRGHKYKIPVFTGDTTQHQDWSAWSDWSVASRYTQGVGYSSQSILVQNYKDAASQKVGASTNTRVNGTATLNYNALSRPTQSPDGTKAMFNSTFLNASDDDIQLFWTVAYYPYPPEIKSAVKNGGNIRLTWDFNQGSSCASQSTNATRTGPTPNYSTPRTYATRGWPHETLDCPPSPREVKQFRVWVSTDNTTWIPTGTAAYNNCSGTNECGMWTETAWTYDYAQPNSSTRYYAVTSLEHSGLESRTLSNVWKVITDGSGSVSSQTQQAAYPADPGGKVAFYVTAPATPTGFTAKHQKSPATTAGQYTLEWAEPADTTLIRHYNIYAKDGSAPTATQQSRIASVPKGTVKYIDWLGNTGGTTQYIITPVDYLGNETGVVVPVQDVTNPVINSFTMPTTATSLNVTITSFIAFDNVGVTGYLVTESSSIAPVAGDAGWSISAPSSFIFSSSGSKNVYAWVKDAAGNVSTSFSGSVVITLPDTTAPIVTAFATPSTSSTLLVSGIGFIATDNISVIGYMITESSAAPTVGAAGWSSSAPTTFSFSAAGAKTAYAWAKDAAGNVSTSFSSNVSITMPDTTSPVVSAFSIPTTASSMTVAVSALTATDAVGVTGYKVTESSTAPTAGAAGWSATVPTTFTFSAAGPKTAYAWAKDAAGNVSTSASRTVTITLADTAAPVVSAFTIPTTATSLTVVVSSLTATDAVGVTGYMITESVTVPTSGAAGWSASAPTTFTFSSAGSKTAYSWAKDAAGNVSASRSATVNITVANTVIYTISDALQALRIASGKIKATSDQLTRLDVAPVINGKSVPNGTINSGDVTVIMSKLVGKTSL